MKRYIKSLDNILCMSNVRGNKLKREGSKPFSFYYSAKQGRHSIRVKPIFNPSKMLLSKAGTLKLTDDWEYTPGEDDKKVPHTYIKDMKAFFRKYLVLFCAVWDEQLDDPTLADYLEGDIELEDLIKELSFYAQHKADLDNIHTIEALEEYCKSNRLVNMYGNA